MVTFLLKFLLVTKLCLVQSYVKLCFPQIKTHLVSLLRISLGNKKTFLDFLAYLVMWLFLNSWLVYLYLRVLLGYPRWSISILNSYKKIFLNISCFSSLSGHVTFSEPLIGWSVSQSTVGLPHLHFEQSDSCSSSVHYSLYQLMTRASFTAKSKVKGTMIMWGTGDWVQFAKNQQLCSGNSWEQDMKDKVSVPPSPTLKYFKIKEVHA